MAKKNRYELTFFGGGMARAYSLPRHRRWHASFEDATAAAREVYARMDECGLGSCAAAHPAIIYGPGCGADGRSVQP